MEFAAARRRGPAIGEDVVQPVAIPFQLGTTRKSREAKRASKLPFQNYPLFSGYLKYYFELNIEVAATFFKLCYIVRDFRHYILCILLRTLFIKSGWNLLFTAKHTTFTNTLKLIFHNILPNRCLPYLGASGVDFEHPS